METLSSAFAQRRVEDFLSQNMYLPWWGPSSS